MSEIETAKPLALESAYNVRDIGFYCNKDGVKLKEGRFLRADALGNLTEKDKTKLEEYGVKAVVDLRSPVEIEKAPCKLCESGKVEYYSVPMFDNIQSNDGTQKMPHSLYELYVSLLDNCQEQIKKVLQIFIDHREGCCLFNCSAGKDRTGVIAMLLLGLADVDEDTIAADYGVSAGYMEPVFAPQRQAMEAAGYGKAAFLLLSDPAQMHKTVDYVNEKYGGIKEYLRRLLSKEEYRLLQSGLVG
ncbi:MAG: tyrosine-protein phosphatase [Lachnospiraceae bacterium]